MASHRDSRGTDEQDENLCTLVESNQLGPAIKSIFDRKLHTAYTDILDRHVQKRDEEIKEICALHYESFIESTENLITSREDVKRLSHKIHQLNAQVQTSGTRVHDKGRQLMELRYVKRNVMRTMELVADCRFVTSLVTKAMDHIEEKKFSLALKTLDQLQRHYHGSEVKGFRFAKVLELHIPQMYLKIASTVKFRYKEWLTTADRQCRHIGIEALRRVATEWLRDDERASKSSLASSPSRDYHAAKKRAPSQLSSLLGAELSQSKNGKHHDLFNDVALDFSPVYQCLHICESMNMPFVDDYKSDRKQQLDKLLDALPRDAKTGSFDFQEFFAQIAGFFFIEDQIVKSGNQLMNLGDLQLLWENAILKIKMVIAQQLEASIKHPRQHLKLKEIVSLFRSAVEQCGLFVRPLMEYLFSTRKQFEKLLGTRLEERIKVILEEETFSPLTVRSMGEYSEKLVPCGLEIPLRRVKKANSDTYEAQQAYDDLLKVQQQAASPSRGSGQSQQGSIRGEPSSSLQQRPTIFSSRMSLVVDEAPNARVRDSAVVFGGDMSRGSMIIDERKLNAGAIAASADSELGADFSLSMVMGDDGDDAASNGGSPHSGDDNDESKLDPNASYAGSSSSSFGRNSGLSDPTESDFPITVPFSASVPRIAEELKLFVTDYELFSRHLPDMFSYQRIAVEEALTVHVNQALNSLIDESRTVFTISQASQFAANCTHLIRVCAFLASMLDKARESRGAEMPPTKLTTAETQFHATRTRCEDMIFELVNHKLNEFLSLYLGLEWCPDRPNGSAQPFIEDLIAYSETTFLYLEFMPDTIKEAVHFTSCKHISTTLMNYLCFHVKKFNIVSIYNLDKDVKRLEEFATGRNIENLVDTFSEIRQLVNLLMSGRVDQILNKEVRLNKFPYLSPVKLVQVLEKYRNLGVFSSCPEGIVNIRKKVVDQVVKKLKSLDG